MLPGLDASASSALHGSIMEWNHKHQIRAYNCLKVLRRWRRGYMHHMCAYVKYTHHIPSHVCSQGEHDASVQQARGFEKM
eukprot:scaffold64034_cov22-Tisochrysis_lutea.AAC.1